MLEAVAATMIALVALKSNLQKVDKSVARKKSTAALPSQTELYLNQNTES